WPDLCDGQARRGAGSDVVGRHADLDARRAWGPRIGAAVLARVGGAARRRPAALLAAIRPEPSSRGAARPAVPVARSTGGAAASLPDGLLRRCRRRRARVWS